MEGFNTSPSAWRVRALKGLTHLSPVHALHFGLADWVRTPAPRQLTTNSVDYNTLFPHVLTLSIVGIRHYDEKKLLSNASGIDSSRGGLNIEDEFLYTLEKIPEHLLYSAFEY